MWENTARPDRQLMAI